MEDIYGDLENYNEVNKIAELVKEKKKLKLKFEKILSELKFQLDKITSEKETLQKDILQEYDKISSEFKILSINYSSLLKTSRAEVERKTQLITNLNIEKDMLVINSLQNFNKNILSNRRNYTVDRSNNYKKNRRDGDADYGKTNKNSGKESTKFDTDKDRIEENRPPSFDTISTDTSGGTKFGNMETKLPKSKSYNDKSCESKENMAKIKSRPQGIRNRRKSMPVLGKQQPKFSTDDENDDNYSTEETNKKDWHPREDQCRRIADRNYNNQSLKISETSGIDEKYSSYHESSRETYYKNKPIRYSDKYRGFKEKYEQSQRYRRHFSPEKHHRRLPTHEHSDEHYQRPTAREHSNEHYQRPDYVMHRVLESPPLDRFNARRVARERRSNYERDNAYDDRQRYRFDKQPVKHKVPSDYDEPSSKRSRTDTSNRYLEEDRRRRKESEFTEQPMTPVRAEVEHLEYISCQSPDYVHNTDTCSTQPIKEIMDTAASHLEDPRLTSRKYLTKTEDKKVVLATVVGRNVDLKLVDVSKWGISTVAVPEALQRPPEYTDEYVQELYNIDSDYPTMYTSMESGEIQTEEYDLYGFETDSYNNQDGREKDLVLNTQKVVDVQERQIENIKKIEDQTTHSQSIPKLKNTDKDSTNHNDIIQPPGNLPDLSSVNEDVYKCPDKLKKPTDSHKTSLKLNIDNRYHNTNKINKTNNKLQDKLIDTNTSSQLKGKNMNSFREIVEGDLELSDETSDNIENQKQITTGSKLSCETSTDKPFPRDDKVTECSEASIKHVTEDLNGCKIVQVLPEMKCKEKIVEKSENSKKIKTRKSQRNKGSTKEAAKEEVVAAEKKIRAKKETTQTEIKAKFSDLFGDSSSLITPEDLGIVSDTRENQSTCKYIPIFEDALDAIDVNVEELGKVQKQTKKLASDVEEVQRQATKPANDIEVHMKVQTQKIKPAIDIEEHRKLQIQATTPAIDVAELRKVQTQPTNSIFDDAGGDDVPECKSRMKSCKTNKLSTDSKKKKSKKINEDITDTPSNTKETVSHSEILNCKAVTKEPDVVSTVIISTGVQPHIAQETKTDLVTGQILNDVVHVSKNVNLTEFAIVEKATSSALATSTPYKVMVKNIQEETESRPPESSSNSSVITIRNDTSSPADQSTTSNEIDTDVPDVRIFVRRRRKTRRVIA